MDNEKPASHEAEPAPVVIGDVLRFSAEKNPITHRQGRNHLVVESDGGMFEALALPPEGADGPYGMPGTEFVARGGYDIVGRFSIEETVEALVKSLYGSHGASEEERERIRRSLS